MKKSSKNNIRDQVMGLGQTSMRKNYYRELMDKQKALEEKNVKLQNEVDRRKAAEEKLKALNEELEAKVLARTKALEKSNGMLKAYIDELEEAQNQLIEQEKLASLGTLVRGISHEINTPLGVSLTTASFMKESADKFQDKLKEGSLTKSEFESDIQSFIDAGKILLTSLNKSVTLVNNFKNIASDNSHEQLEEIKVYDYINMILTGMVHDIDDSFSLTKSICCDRDLSLKMYPGILSQLLTIFVSNSIAHGFSGRHQGCIDIELFVENDFIHFNYYDDGQGVDESIIGNIFDPFFTTTRTGKTSGLGLYIAYNLVIQLGGTISFANRPHGGVIVEITVPVNHMFIKK